MSSAQCAVATANGANRMRTSWRSLEPKGIEDYLKDFCKAYRGEEDNPYDVNATDDEERAIQFLRYHMWDIEKSIMEQPGYWRYLVIEHHGSLPCDDESIARKIYNFAVKVKLDRLSEIGINLNEIYRRFNK